MTQSTGLTPETGAPAEAAGSATDALAADVRRGLTSTPKRLSSVFFYDAEGSRLFDEITRQPEYYLTRTERAIFEAHAADILACANDPATLIELGAGSADKTRILLARVVERHAQPVYAPVDVSAQALREASEALEREFPTLRVVPVHARNRAGLKRLEPLEGEPARLVLFIGSSIGNFDQADAIAFLADVAQELRPEDALLLGTDMLKDERILVPAYDDAAGLTRRFNLNLLARINRELDADFDLDAFDHVARFNAQDARMESYLVSRLAQTVTVRALGLTVALGQDEAIHTENSYKYSREEVQRLTTQAGLRIERSWYDSEEWFGVHLLRSKIS